MQSAVAVADVADQHLQLVPLVVLVLVQPEALLHRQHVVEYVDEAKWQAVVAAFFLFLAPFAECL